MLPSRNSDKKLFDEIKKGLKAIEKGRENLCITQRNEVDSVTKGAKIGADKATAPLTAECFSETKGMAEKFTLVVTTIEVADKANPRTSAWLAQSITKNQAAVDARLEETEAKLVVGLGSK